MSWVLLFAYQALGTVAFLLAVPFLLLRAVRHPEEMAERMGWRGPRLEGSPLWLHAASLGELQSLQSLLQDRERELAPPLLLTVLSVSARRAGAIPCPVRFAPVDLWFAVWPFLRRVKPRGLVLVETELWPFTLAACRARGVPVVVVSGRLSQRRWRRTRRLRPLLRPLVSRLAGVGAQSEADAERFRWLGVPAVQVAGNLKYRMNPAAQLHDSQLVRRQVDQLFLLVAGSVRTGEEGVLDCVGGSGEDSSTLNPGSSTPGSPREGRLLLVLAPRHLREREHWIEACAARRVRASLRSRSDLPAPVPGAAARAAFRAALSAIPGELLLLDTHGELGRFYAAADAAFVGGTLVPIGGHNLFEPAREGIPVAFGPHTGGVADLAEPLLRRGGGFRVEDGAALRQWVEGMRADPAAHARAGAAAREAAAEVAGGVARTWGFLESFPWAAVRRRGAAGTNPAADAAPLARGPRGLS
jgi:3-deoxy-D-manno-octulosonic-acid transferase